MLAPKKVKWRKQQKGRTKGKALRGSKLTFGDYGLQARKSGKITARQIEAARVSMTRSIKRGGDVRICIFPHRAVTKKAAETRMGSGKGNVESWCALVKSRRVLFEIKGVPQEEAIRALTLASYKLPITCKILASVNLQK